MNVLVVLVGLAGIALCAAVVHADYRARRWCNHDEAAVVNGVCECGEVVDRG